MTKKFKGKGYSTDLKLGWVTSDLGSNWLQWQQYAAEWLTTKDTNLSARLEAIRKFLLYLNAKAPYAADVATMFKGHPSGHKVSNEELDAFMVSRGTTADKSKYISFIVDLCDYILKHHLSAEDDHGVERPLFPNPFEKIKANKSSTETVHSPLPYRYIQQVRHILCPYPTDDPGNKTPWVGFHFRDWQWAIDHLQPGNQAWMEVPPEVIDPDDPDCVARTRLVQRKIGKLFKSVTIHEIWSPVLAMFLFTKLHLPLRSYQVRFLDSGEGDTWRYESGHWVENTKHRFKYGTPKRPYQKGVFRRIYDSMTESFATGLYISTNKTADQNKDEIQRGYTIPWQHEELLYWLEKLRNWQEKYNPIDRLVNGTELQRRHVGKAKSKKQLTEMGEFAFLFRERNSALPIGYTFPDSPWYRLLSKLEEDVFQAGQAMANGDRLQFVKDYGEDYEGQESSKVATEYPLHSLRVSLITCYTMDTDLPLPVISKLLAGHTRLLMTIYYNKITPSVMAEKMNEADSALVERGEASLKNFLQDAEMRQIKLRTAFHADTYNSVATVLANRNPIGWEERATGLCLVGGNSVRSDELAIVGGCWNGGPLFRDSATAHSRVYGSVPHGPENCPRCRWHITDATYLPALNSKFNQVSYQAHQAAELAVEIEGQLEALKDELFIAEDEGKPFLKHSELQALERRYEKQRVEADEYVKDYIAIFNLINKVVQIENGRTEDDDRQKLIAVGSAEDLNVSMKFIETDSELLHLSLLCEDAEFYPDLHDDLRKTPAITKRTNALSRMMARSGYKPVFLEMDENTQLIVGNALVRKMAKIADPDDKMEGYRIATNYIEAQEFLENDGLLKSGFEAIKQITPITLSSGALKRIPALEVFE
ncbi:integrase [Halopseudomonas pachastrellae]|uniref:Integrase n=1 Tax=Halopseudomonas pachastrellae TaxID=254161 RepID=A0A1S8DDL2_9GAMM|nr:VPA1269 family protein [Halopseudomonas pachastrellae]ONM42620.1 integrase [Halopseudomonas pachastrellae]SFM99502.1 Putative phage integrase [Halopseudomonas pachastrellae]